MNRAHSAFGSHRFRAHGLRRSLATVQAALAHTLPAPSHVAPSPYFAMPKALHRFYPFALILLKLLTCGAARVSVSVQDETMDQTWFLQH